MKVQVFSVMYIHRHLFFVAAVVVVVVGFCGNDINTNMHTNRLQFCIYLFT